MEWFRCGRLEKIIGVKTVELETALELCLAKRFSKQPKFLTEFHHVLALEVESMGAKGFKDPLRNILLGEHN